MASRPRAEARRAGQGEGNAGTGMAKIYHSLYDRMLYEKGLLQAFAKFKSNKGSPGVDGQIIEDFAEHLFEEIALLADTYLLRSFERRIGRSRIRGPYVRFCERDEVN